MATLICPQPFSSVMKFLMYFSILILLIPCFHVKKSFCLEGRKESHFHVVEVSSLLPASVCSSSSTPSILGSYERQSALDIHHRYGPCSQLGQQKAKPTYIPSLSEILSNDQSRVNSIQARINPNYSNTTNHFNDQKTNLPVQSGQSLGSGDYIVTIGLGNPRKTLSLIFDTSSDLTWTQCEPCIRSCYQQQDPIFDPSISTTYSNVSCNSEQCSQLSSATGNFPGCASTTCIYRMRYGDESFSVGFFAKEKLTLATNDVFQEFFFGCGQNNQGPFGNTAGILGLGRHPLSFVSQTAPKYGKYFSYCLPSTPSQTGYLKLGKNELSNNVKYTPFATYNSQGKKLSSFYFIEIISIIIGGRQLPVFTQSTSKTIIDSTTVITRLPPKAYYIMRDEFKKLMTRYPIAPGYSILDTCYDLSGYRYVTIPVITIVFSGNVKVNLAASGILIVISRTRICLAFAANDYETDVGIFGSTQQKTLEVVYDVGGGYLGFGPVGCK